MLSLILLLIGGSIIAYLSLQNTMIVSLHFLDYTIPSLPLYYVIIGSMLVGLLLSYVIYLVHSIIMNISLHGKDRKIMKEKEQVAELTKRIHQLELENVRLKNQTDTDTVDSNSL
jgi:lipopolysaccharide assembly protein A